MKRFIKKLFVALIFLGLLAGVCGTAALVGIFMGYAQKLPSVEDLKGYNPSLITRVYDVNDVLLTSFYIERREIVPLESIPVALQNAVIAVEDANFFTHRGIDPQGIMRAMMKNVMAGGIVQGGSTITQQVARAVFLSPEKKYTRKMKEAILAYRMEKLFTKDDILWLYLNHIYFGHGAYGVEAAARSYFGRHVSELTLVEFATLAGLPKAPNRYSPVRNPEAARLRLKLVLARMLEEGYVTPEEAREALDQDLDIRYRRREPSPAPYFVEHVRRYLEKQYGSDLLYRGGLHVYTTLDRELQEAAENSIVQGLRELDKRQGYRGPEDTVGLSIPGALEAFIQNRGDWPASVEEDGTYPGVVMEVKEKEALLRMASGQGILPLKNMLWVYGRAAGREPKAIDEVLSPGDIISARVVGTGEEGSLELALEQEPLVEGALMSIDLNNGNVMSMVGGYDFSRSEFNRAVQSRRQPGSAFKPLIYAAAVEQGYTPADIIIDSPIVWENKEEEAKIKKWKPENYEERFYGRTLLRTALARSRNVSTIKLLKKIGVRPVIDLAARLGVESPLAEDLSLALGSSGVTLQELTGAYAVFSTRGVYTPPVFIRYITDHWGNLMEVHQPRPRRVMEAEDAYIVNSMLQSVIQEGTGWRIKALKRPAGGKTGTTNEFIDAWFMGFTPQMATGVWVGFDDEKTLGKSETGSRAAAPIWLSFMQEAVRGRPVEVFQIPPGIIFAKIDTESGLLASPKSREVTFECFVEGTEPRETARPEKKTPTDFFRLDLDRLSSQAP